jgi:hypothetical protein
MTTLTLSSRDARASAALEAVLTSELSGAQPKSVHVTARDNHSGEPALYVYVVVPSARHIPDEAEQNRLVLRMIEALEGIDDGRFPYLYFGPVNLDEGGWRSASGNDEPG